MLPPVAEPLTIAHVTPYALEGAHEVNLLVDRVTAELRERGHRVVVVAPSRDQGRVRDSRALIRRAGDDPGLVFDADVLAVGEVLPELPTGSRRRAPGLPVDVTRTIEELLAAAPPDVLHVHEPFALSTAAAALRHSRSLNAGTFHAPAERLVSTRGARRIVELLFGRLDARVASFEATAEVMRRFFPGDYHVILPGADPVERAPRGDGRPVRIAFADVEERAALRLVLRALRRLDRDASWDAVIIGQGAGSPAARLPEALRGRVTMVAPEQEAHALAEADVVVAASAGAFPAPGLVLRAVAAGAVPLVSAIPVYEELAADGERAVLFATGEPESLAAQLGRLVADGALRDRVRDAASPLRGELSWTRAADAYEALYAGLIARRRPLEGDAALGRRLARRATIDIDLHMHTDHSPDCATPVEVLLETARSRGIGAIAVTDHNEVSGAFEAQAKADEYGVKVIIGEEVKTASQGEVIGLFLKEKIPRGMTLEETVAEIKRQGGVVYVPHPFDRLHSVPDYEHLLGILDDIDVLEIYNPRVAIGAFNEEAVRFAGKYRLLAAAGSDSHVAQGLGTVRNRVPDFDGPEEFLEALRAAEITTKPNTLLYVQALKFLETTATPPAARRAIRERRVRKATRKA